jgi:DNA-binding PadR family transcriptional regulator
LRDLDLPRTLIVMQTVFGSPLADKKEFRAGDVGELTIEDLGRANHTKALDKLLELGWIEVTVQRETETKGGRPSKYLYTRTRRGVQRYKELGVILSRYGIDLR